MIETNPEALGHARALDEEREKGKIRGPLHGIPVLVKDVRLFLNLSGDNAYLNVEHGNGGSNADDGRIVGVTRLRCTKRRSHRSSPETSWCRYPRQDEPGRMGWYER